MPDYLPVDLIRTKRDGGSLDAETLTHFIHAYTRGEVPDYQMSAFLMAAALNGLDEAEATAFTEAMLYSGTVLDLSDVDGIKVDKHSTGGVGDKVSLILAPIVSACGVPVPMISGRGLGHTGGTLDKLESIPGFRTNLSIEVYKKQLAELGLVMIGQTDNIAPADRKLYALRDVTATVECIPLIAASIMSKKLAAGIDALVLDVKCGQGAFMKTEDDARRLAETLVDIGERFEKDTVALLTRMEHPLGRAVGNWPEVVESIRCLEDDWEGLGDLKEVTLALAGEMLYLGEKAETPEEGRAQAAEAVRSGKAREMLLRLVETQGGDPSAIEDPSARPDSAPAGDVVAPKTMQGYVSAINAYRIGMTTVAMGAGRRTKEDPVDPTAGLVLHKKPGEPVVPGDTLATLYTTKTDRLDVFSNRIQTAFTVSEEPPEDAPMVMGRFTQGSWAEASVASAL